MGKSRSQTMCSMGKFMAMWLMKRISFWLILIPGVVLLALLYRYNPLDGWFYPRCPFFSLTGWQCPGCGTLRALHCLLHGRIAEAWDFNPAMMIALPVLVILSVYSKFARSARSGWVILVAIVAWWIGRNMFR